MIRSSFSALLPLLLLAACEPPAAGPRVERVDLAQTGAFASAPAPSPDTTGAAWAKAGSAGRIVYAPPGRAPLVALECTAARGVPLIRLTRHAPADRGAKALAPVVGNGHVIRIPVDAAVVGESSIWQGTVAAADPGLAALTGTGAAELTVPGAGTVLLNPSPLPGALLARCLGPAR